MVSRVEPSGQVLDLLPCTGHLEQSTLGKGGKWLGIKRRLQESSQHMDSTKVPFLPETAASPEMAL